MNLIINIVLGVSIMACGALIPSEVCVGIGGLLLVTGAILEYLREYHSMSAEIQTQFDEAKQQLEDAESDFKKTIGDVLLLEQKINQLITKGRLEDEYRD